MLIRIIRYIKGYVLIRVSGYSPERFMNLCSNHNILIWGLKAIPADRNQDEEYQMYMSVRAVKSLRPIVKKTKTRIVIEERHGLPFFLHKYRKRKMFFAGLILCAVLIYILSLFIWNIHIDGNLSRTDDVILEYLESAGTYHGIPKNRVDCDQIVSGIRKEYDDIIWVSAEISGTRLIIKVRENTDSGDVAEEEAVAEEPGDLVAEKDGIITEIITRSGVPQVSIGDVVKKGDLLVSGRIEVLDDAGEVGEYQYSVSDSDIYARTVYDYEDVFPLDYAERMYTEEVKKGYYINIMDRKIYLWSPSVDYPEYDAVTEENQWKLGESFYLPVSFGTITYSAYVTEAKRYDEAGAKARAAARLEDYLEELSKKGVQIIENNVTILMDQDTCTATGKIQVIEPIGVSQPTEIIAAPEKEDEEGTNTDEYSGTDT